MSATSDYLNEETFAALRATPGFRRACETAATTAMQEFLGLEPAYQWITKDLGRSAICLTAAILHYAGELTVQTLTAINVANEVSSPGRVNQLVRRCQEIDQFTVEDGAGIWTRRRARLGPGLLAMLHRRALCDMRAAVSLAPELRGALAILDTEEGAVSALMHLGHVTSERPDLFRFAHKRPLNFFLDREAGMAILFDLLGSQAPDRQLLLEAAPLSRYALARRYGVSRAHINKLLGESGQTQTVGDRILFSETLSEAMEAHFSLIFALNLGLARLLIGGWRFQRPSGDALAPASAA